MSNQETGQDQEALAYARLCEGSLNEQALMADWDDGVDDVMASFADRANDISQ